MGEWRRGSFDPTAFVAGVVFLAIGAAFLVEETEWIGVDIEARWIWPALLIGLGLAGLLSGIRRDRGRQQDGED